MEQIFIYGLFDRGVLFYVGQTSRGAVEPERYIVSGWRGGSGRRLNRRLKRLHKNGIRATWEILEEASTVHDLDDLETFWISSMRACGAELMNAASGGRGGNRYMSRTPEQRASHSENQRRRMSRPEYRAKLRQIRKAQVTEETRRKVSLSLLGNTRRRGKTMPEAARRQISASLKGKKKTPQHVMRIAAGASRVKTPEECFKLKLAAKVTQMNKLLQRLREGYAWGRGRRKRPTRDEVITRLDAEITALKSSK